MLYATSILGKKTFEKKKTSLMILPTHGLDVTKTRRWKPGWVRDRWELEVLGGGGQPHGNRNGDGKEKNEHNVLHESSTDSKTHRKKGRWVRPIEKGSREKERGPAAKLKMARQ